ncbi:fungal hydrophobin-domain-containing protein [Xylariales sp. PMI_506]|nr:fungal hydrophobin-domain-containing protein [Xylariales sp. PMI_506]
MLTLKLSIPFFALVAVAAGQKCDTADIQCCQQVAAADDGVVRQLASLLGIGAELDAGPVGLTCTPITLSEVHKDGCSAQSVCCKGQNFNGLIALDCSPFEL